MCSPGGIAAAKGSQATRWSTRTSSPMASIWAQALARIRDNGPNPRRLKSTQLDRSSVFRCPCLQDFGAGGRGRAVSHPCDGSGADVAAGMNCDDLSVQTATVQPFSLGGVTLPGCEGCSLSVLQV